MLRRTFVTAPKVVIPQHLNMPLPQQFGLSARFDGKEYIEAIEKRKNRDKSIMTYSSWIIAFVVNLYVLGLFSEEGEDIYKSILFYGLCAFFACLFSMPILFYIEKAYGRIVGDLVDPSVRSYFEAVVAYDAALRDWNDRQLETGQAYWREKRGVAFERALRDFLIRRGCSVDTTKGSGDGGVDLIVRLGGATYWCQCKGHASPIGVAVVREIAGVCSRGGGSPVVIAVNGYTSSAVETANQLGVLLIDTHQLISLAKQDRISQWQ